jgi:hypothetical protein
MRGDPNYGIYSALVGPKWEGFSLFLPKIPGLHHPKKVFEGAGTLLGLASAT